MDTLNTIFSRKPIRNYTGEAVSPEQEALILKAANAAPVGMGQYDTVHLTIIKNKELLSEIDSTAAALMKRPDSHPLYGAPELIVVSVKFNPSTEGAGHANAAMIDHNMALAATELGVGCVYIYGAVAAIRMKPDLLAKLHLPEGFTPSAGLAIGLTEEKYVEREIPTDRISQNIIV